MKIKRLGQLAIVLVAMLTIGSAGAETKKEFAEATSADGLEKISVKGIDLAYSRPGSTLAAYTRVRIDPVQVSFRKDFSPEKTGSRIKMSTEELEKLRADVGKLVRDEFVAELAKGSYTTVEVAGPDVLQVRASVVNLYVNAPDTMEPGRSRTYTMSAGEMTLVTDLIDSETGEVLARAYDRREARDTGSLTWTNSVTNQAEARRVASSWAKILVKQLDAAKGIGKK